MSRRCGKPVGLSYYPKNDLLYISDAFLGILSVGMEGGLASVLVEGEYKCIILYYLVNHI